MTQRVVITEYGHDPLDAIAHHLVLEPQERPDPADLAPTDVVVAVRAASVGWVDLIMTSGQYQHMPEPPYTPGLEYAGEVVWAGAEVTGLAPGDRVLNDGFLSGPRSHGAHRRWGGFAAYAVAPERALHRIPGALSFDQACNLLGNYETAYHCLIARGRLTADDTVLILGASGSTGLAAVHVAKRVGATVIATGRSADKLAVVEAQGADHVVHAPDGQLRDRVKALTGGRGVSVVYDGVGGLLSVEAMRCTAFGARFLVVGWAGTPDVAKGKGGRGAPRANHLPTNRIMMKGLDVLGCPTIIGTINDPSLRPPRMAWVFEGVAAGELVPHVAASYPLSEVREAMRAKWRSEHVGGCTVRPGG